jgi:C4-dicarboxylate-specific signal transduction histidine kinase
MAGNGEAVIEVRDNGAGFPSELLPRLGEPFLTTRPTQRSAGLGLFIMRGVVDAQGGALELENAPEGGAVVRFRLRAAAK